jgi:hypothetical protein
METAASGGGRPPLTLPDSVERPIGNPLGIYGRIERMRIGKSLVKRRPTEVSAARHIRWPDDPEFVPPPALASHLRCHTCKKMKAPGDFHADKRYILRGGRRTECKLCRKKLRARL